VELSPLFGLRLRTPRLVLRLPVRRELFELALVAAGGIHPPDEMPFAVAWTDSFSADTFVAHHLAARERWRPESWSLLLGVWAEGRLAGCQEVAADDFALRRTVRTGSWLGRTFQGRGYGTEMRAAVLELAFGALRADAAESGALQGSLASARVSEKLGYEPAGESVWSPRGEPVREQRFRLERPRWEAVERPPVRIERVERCLPLFGVPGRGRKSD
jgi:RimJ/RimL family protein N-acetyltransferase